MGIDRRRRRRRRWRRRRAVINAAAAPLDAAVSVDSGWGKAFC